jgi:YHS domain-containing protein
MMIPKSNNTATVIDPVCGMTVGPKDRSLVSKYKNSIYYFCAKTCRTAFDENPEKYLAEKSDRPKGFWKRYLERLNKATGGKPPQCCQ